MSKMIAFLISVLLIILIISCYSTSFTREPCPPCYGSGKCNICRGVGYTRDEGRCRTCSGNGKCIACGGSGIYSRVIAPWDAF